MLLNYARFSLNQCMCYMRDHVPNALTLIRERMSDGHPRVRLEAVRACSFFDDDDAIEVALEVLEKDIDTYLQYTLDETMRHLENR